MQTSATGTWFQSPEAYGFYESQTEIMRPFVIAVEEPTPSPSLKGGEHHHPSLQGRNEKRLLRLRGVCVGYVTVEKSSLKQYFTRRAIILGGPVIANDATSEEVEALMRAVKNHLSLTHSLIHSFTHSPIYIETRNFNDYSRWKSAFAAAGFEYRPHLNFHVQTNLPWEIIEANIGKHRRKYIRLSFRDGATIEEHPTLEQVRAYYEILSELYRTKVKTPLQPWSFFERLYHLESCKYLLVMYEGKVIGGSIVISYKMSAVEPLNDAAKLPNAACGTVYEWFACGKDGVYKNIYPSSVTKYAGIKFAADNGYAVFDMMGAGKPDEAYGVRDFKAEFGGRLVEYGRYLCVCNTWLYSIGKLGVKLLKGV